ncbi:DUF3168 domain-containing protein [Brevibacillus agri]|uniref:tail completion protein gp17 n=1 Tax=Brevibacillus agri TaxID=51101 RepID=UPI002E1CB8E6|nr:DUF3168 domain-containing protein [Brevibacillus agri]MED1652600.1 DUF3168 domain-containing protein [Brevibacillus agri]MED1689646.1 DUF3168 domain-containing protein [Brevibacillus agri]MED1691116.1 DUF3168 domain-containing protein [Brevibacillus agri]MED1696774.1 DUF3168 domain-containing protein [Brevibacillus agri]
MKTDIKTEVRAALLNNAALVSLLGGQRVYQLVAPKADEYPRITFFEVTNYDAAFADDVPIMADVIVQIDVWSKVSTSAISGEVNKTMKAQGWSRTSAADLYEDDTQVYHKALRYRRQYEED